MASVDNDLSDTEARIIRDVWSALSAETQPRRPVRTWRDLFRAQYKEPDVSRSLSEVPYCVSALQSHDCDHGTDYATKARAVLLLFVNGVAKTDGTVSSEEINALTTYKEFLDSVIRDPCASRNSNLTRSLKETIHELVAPLECVQRQIHEKGGGRLPNGLDLLMGELTNVALIFANIDLNLSEQKRDLLNDFYRSIYVTKTLILPSDDFFQLCRKFVGTYPDRWLSIDYTPDSVQYLQSHDREHGTEYAEKAKAIFFRLASAIVNADGVETSQETITLLNFKEILDSGNSPIALSVEVTSPDVHESALPSFGPVIYPVVSVSEIFS